MHCFFQITIVGHIFKYLIYILIIAYQTQSVQRLWLRSQNIKEKDTPCFCEQGMEFTLRQAVKLWLWSGVSDSATLNINAAFCTKDVQKTEVQAIICKTQD